MNVLLFAGTTEGRQLARRLLELPVHATICVATEYGGEMLDGAAGRFPVLVGRMESEAMRTLMKETECRCVVDATHPYATEVSANIREAADAAGVPRLRLVRDESGASSGIFVESTADAVGAVAGTSGNVLLATGSKDLAAYTAIPNYADRVFPRVLPSVESVRACADLGFRRDHVIAMQGPFSRELNLAIFRQYGIAVMVTKDGGAAGGFPEKMQAAGDAGVAVIVIGRPAESGGHSLDGIVERIREMTEAEA